jgi:TonB-dependent receptor
MRFKLLCGTAAFLAYPVHATAQATEEPATITVTGQRASQQRAVDLKRRELGVVDVAAADDIGQLPDRNVAEVVERLPGVGVQYDQGEGRYVSIRGIPSDLNQYTLNGFELGNPDGNTRRLPLDVISGQLLNRIEVYKVKTSDQDGQGIGGLVNLVTQTAFDFSSPTILQANAQVGRQQIDKRNPFRGDVVAGARLGEVGLLGGASWSKRTFTSFGFFPDDWSPVRQAARGGLPINIKFTDYRLTRERLGLSGSLDWRPRGSDTRLWVRGIYTKFTEDEYRQRYRLDFASGGGGAQALVDAGTITLAPGGVTGTSTRTELRQDLRLEYKEKSLLAGMAGGSSRLGGFDLDFGLARIHNEVIEPNQLWQFRNNTSIGPVDFDFTDELYRADVRTPVPASNIQFRQYTAQDENGTEDIWQGRLDGRHDLGIGEASWFKLGMKGRSTEKDFDVENQQYDRGTAANRFTLVDAGAAGGPVRVRVQPDRTYLIPISIDEDAIRAFTEGKLGGPQFVRNAATSLANGTLSDTDVEEDVVAGYAMANLDWGAVELTAGLRLERTDQKVTGFRLQNNSLVLPVTEESDYTNLLPSLIARYRGANGLVLRAAYSRSVGRPAYLSLSPGGRVTVEVDQVTVALGNSRLKPFVSDNLDASVEYYFGKGGLLSAGLFAKWIRDPIFTFGFTETNANFAGTTYARVITSQPRNGRTGRLTGLELAYNQQFTFLPGALSGFGFSGNLTLVDSRLDYPDGGNGTRRIAFPEQSDLLWGAQLFYQRGPVEASVAYHHTGRALLGPGANPDQDLYNDDLRRLDAKASLQLSRNIGVFVEAQNLTDEPTRQYQSPRRDWSIQEERYGRAYWLGVSVKL